MYSRINELKKTKDVDILFLGSSHAYRGFDTRIFKNSGYRSFNLGSSGQTPIQTNILLERYLDTLNPKLIIYEVFPSTFSSDGVESSVDLIANDKIDFKTFRMAIELNNVKTYNTLLYGYYRQLFDKDKGFEEGVLKGDDRYVPGGFVEQKLVYNNAAAAKAEMIDWTPKPYQIKAFENILKLIKEKQIELILVQSPVTRIAFKKYKNNKNIDAYFSKKAEYYNFNYLVNMNDILNFYDENHLNQEGVKVFKEGVRDALYFFTFEVLCIIRVCNILCISIAVTAASAQVFGRSTLLVRQEHVRGGACV
jgi:hypothetical protein